MEGRAPQNLSPTRRSWGRWWDLQKLVPRLEGSLRSLFLGRMWWWFEGKPFSQVVSQEEQNLYLWKTQTASTSVSITHAPHNKSYPCRMCTLLPTPAPHLPCLSLPCAAVVCVLWFPSDRQGVTSSYYPGTSRPPWLLKPAAYACSPPGAGHLPGPSHCLDFSPVQFETLPDWGPCGLLSWVSPHNPELWLTRWPVGLGPSWLLLGFQVVLTPPSQEPVAGQEMGEEARSCLGVLSLFFVFFFS